MNGERQRSVCGELAGEDVVDCHSQPPSALAPTDLQKFLACTLMMCKRQRERPLFTVEAQIFVLQTQNQSRTWEELSSRPVPVHLFHDTNRHSYRIISVEGSKPVLNGTVTGSLMMNKASSKFLQWLDTRSNSIYGLGFASERDLNKFMEAVSQVQVLARQKCTVDQPPRSGSDPSLPEETFSTAGTNEQMLKLENERLKAALAQSSANAKKWEQELQSLKEMNRKLTEALNRSRLSSEGVKEDNLDWVMREMKTILSSGQVAPLCVTQPERDNSSPSSFAPADLLQQLEGIVELKRNLEEEVNRLEKNSREWKNGVESLHEEIGLRLRDLLRLHETLTRRLHSLPESGAASDKLPSVGAPS